MKILVINAGSSSLKYQLINSDSEEVLAKGLCERIGIDGSLLTHTPAGGDKVKIETPMPNHTVAVKLVLDALTDAKFECANYDANTGYVTVKTSYSGMWFQSDFNNSSNKWIPFGWRDDAGSSCILYGTDKNDPLNPGDFCLEPENDDYFTNCYWN